MALTTYGVYADRRRRWWFVEDNMSRGFHRMTVSPTNHRLRAMDGSGRTRLVDDLPKDWRLIDTRFVAMVDAVCRHLRHMLVDIRVKDSFAGPRLDGFDFRPWLRADEKIKVVSVHGSILSGRAKLQLYFPPRPQSVRRSGPNHSFIYTPEARPSALDYMRSTVAGEGVSCPENN